MQAAMKRFDNLINSPAALERGRLAFFYYSGHGGTSGGKQELMMGRLY